MDLALLDHLARALATGTPRRTAMAVLFGSGMTALTSRLAVDEVGARKKKKKKNKRAAPPPPPVPPAPPPLPPPPPPLPFIQTCPGPANEGEIGARRFAQTFTAEASGLLTNAACDVLVESAADFTLEIRPLDGSGVPLAAVLASDTVAGNGASTLSAVFDPPAVTGTLGQAFVLRARGGDPCSGQLFEDVLVNDNFVAVDAIDMVFSATIAV